jgi:hypothetical protein
MDAAEVQVRPVDEPGLEGVAAVGFVEHNDHRSGDDKMRKKR